MIGTCPQCDAALRNPMQCPCGWTLEKVDVSPSGKPISQEQLERNRLCARQFKTLAHRLAGEATEYVPGEDQ